MSARGSISLGIYEKALPPVRDWDIFFRTVAQTGFGFTDLAIDESPERSGRLEWTPARRRAVRASAERAGVGIGGLCLSVHRRIMPGSADPAIRARAAEVFCRAIDLARDLGTTVVQVAGYYAYYEPPDPAAERRYLDTLMDAIPYAARAGIILGLENVDGPDISSIPDVMSVVDRGRSPWLQAYPDIGNIAEHSGNMALELAAAEGHMVALHVKDARPGEPRRVPFGRGAADFDAAFMELSRQDWSGRMLIEMWNAPDTALALSVQAREFITDRLRGARLTVTPPSPDPESLPEARTKAQKGRQ